MKKFIFTALLLAGLASTSFAQHGGRYWKRLNKTHPEVPVESLFNPAPLTPSTEGYRLSMTYNGKFRKISSDVATAMQKIGLTNRDLKDYQYELLFLHENQEIWLPVQSELIEQLQIEVAENEPVTLYTAIFQTPSDGEVPHKTVLVQEFKVN